jgi:ATP-dependent Lon protease
MTQEAKNILPVLPLRDIVVFPGMIVPLFVGREKSVKSLEATLQSDRRIFLITQKDPSQDNPAGADLQKMGIIGNVLQVLKLPDGTIKILAEATDRALAVQYIDDGHHMMAQITPVVDIEGKPTELEALGRSAAESFDNYVKLNKKINPDALSLLEQITQPGRLADLIASQLIIKVKEKQKILEMLDVNKRLEHLLKLMEAEIGVMNTEKKIRTRVKRQMEKKQKEYYLNEQLQAIQKELGDGEGKSEVAELEEKINKVKLSPEAKEKALAEFKKMKTVNAMSAEATVIRNYLDWLLSIPWKELTKVKHNILSAQEALNENHYAIEKVKDRILEYLAVQQRKKDMKGPILCLVGPPGVGKTTLAKSIAAATGRNFVRFSLGGVRDESEIRGHRRTYIGSMPGKIVQMMKKAKSSNPLFLLDEIDKMGVDFRGDPASALLEVLDPEQNATFVDHYLEVEYDLSNVMFIATANSLNMPRPLLDRMEIIRLPGYTEDEKIEIAKRHLVPKLIKDHGLKDQEWDITEEGIRELIRYYTREAGVRSLERELANLTRKAVKEILLSKTKIPTIHITEKNYDKYAGVKRFSYGEVEKTDLVGVTNGLAYTEVGGEMLTIEAVSLPGSGKIKTTGKLGDVMQESAQAAFTYIRSKSLDYGITPPKYQKRDIHIHVPEGATPKDGPSAGVAMCTSIVSAMTGIPVKCSVAMTGEVTLRGRVLAIGGLKEKLLAALRAGITTVFIPFENQKDLAEIPDNVKNNLQIIPISDVDSLLKLALARPFDPISDWIEVEPLPMINKAEGFDETPMKH